MEDATILRLQTWDGKKEQIYGADIHISLVDLLTLPKQQIADRFLFPAIDVIRDKAGLFAKS